MGAGENMKIKVRNKNLEEPNTLGALEGFECSECVRALYKTEMTEIGYI